MSLRDSSTQERSNMLSFWCHRNLEIGVEDDENGKIFKLFLTLDKSSAKKKKSLMMTFERLLSFIGTVIRRDTRCMSRGLMPARHVACVLNTTRISHVKGRMSPQPCRTRGNAPKTRDSLLTKIASLQWSHLFSKTRAASS